MAPPRGTALQLEARSGPRSRDFLPRRNWTARSRAHTIANVKTRASESRVLYEIISTVASSLELDEVLRAVVRLLSDASAVRACFVYLVDDEGGRLVLKAASEPYGHLVDLVVLERGEGLAWWVAERP